MSFKWFVDKTIQTSTHKQRYNIFYHTIESNDYYLNVGPNGDLASLQYFDRKNIKQNDTYINVDNRKIPQIRCNVYSAGLNFRDVMFASGILF